MTPFVAPPPLGSGALLPMLRRRWSVLVVCLSSALAAQAAPAPAQSLQGRIVDVLGDPLPAVALHVVVGGKVVARGASDAEGLFVVPRVPADGGELRANAPGKAELRLPLHRFRSRAGALLTLEDGCRLRGKVAGPDGAALAGAAIVLVAGGHSAEASSDERGNYEFAGVPLRFAQVRASTLAGWIDRGLQLVGDTECDFVVPALGHGVRAVRVRGLPADALPGARVLVTSFDLALRGDRGHVPLRADGTAEVVASDTSLVQLIAPGYEATPAGQLIGAWGGATIEFVVAPAVRRAPAATMRGRVRDLQDRPVAGLELTAVDRSYRDAGSATSAADGSFTLPLRLPPQAFFRLGLELRLWRIEADPVRSAFGHTWIDRTVDPAFVLDLRVDRAGSLRGELRGKAGERFGFAEVAVAPADRPCAPFATLVTDRLGGFELGGLPPESYLLTARAAHGEVAVVEVVVTAGRTTAVAGWKLQAGGTLEGQVLDAAGRPVPGLELCLGAPALREGGPAPDGPVAATVVTDRHGRYRCRGLVPGEWTVSVDTGGRTRPNSAWNVGEVRAGRTERVDLQLPR